MKNHESKPNFHVTLISHGKKTNSLLYIPVKAKTPKQARNLALTESKKLDADREYVPFITLDLNNLLQKVEAIIMAIDYLGRKRQ